MADTAKATETSKGKAQNGHGQQQESRSLATNGGARGYGLRRSLSPFSLTSPLSRFRTEFDRLFDDFFRGWPAMSELMERPDTRWDLDVEDQADKVVVHAEAPGFEPQDFDLKVQENQLELCACQSEESTKEGERHWRKQEFYRSIPLPAGIDPEHVDAKYHNGILTITLPKTEQSKARKIEVKA